MYHYKRIQFVINYALFRIQELNNKNIKYLTKQCIFLKRYEKF